MNLGTRATSFEQRLAIVELAHAGQTDAEAALAMGLSESVVRKWRRRARTGQAGLVSHLGRPARGPLSQAALGIVDEIRKLRTAHPGWGPLTLRTELARPAFGQRWALPSRTQIAAFLKADGLTRPYSPHLALAQPIAPPAAEPHAEWEMDAQGIQRVTAVGRVVVINIGDPYSRLLTDSLGCLGLRKASTADYQLALRRAFLRFGLPGSLSLDHDSVFHDPTSASPYPTTLHLWLLALGVSVRFIAVGRPTQHGYIEREHQVMTHQVLDDLAFAGPPALQSALDERRHFLNAAYPNRALGGQPPLQAYPTASHSGRLYSPEREAALLDGQRVYAYLAQHQWYRRVTDRGQFELGTYRYGLGAAWGKQLVHLTLDPQTLELICQSANQQRTCRLPGQGLQPADWMGELQLAQLPSYQIAFSWSAPACRMSQLCEDWAGTTFPDNRL
jgi:transposase-like protein